MSDYSFMKTGNDNINTQNGMSDDVIKILALFTSKSLENANRHVRLCGRNGITETDIRYSLIYETIEFLNTPNLKEELESEELYDFMDALYGDDDSEYDSEYDTEYDSEYDSDIEDTEKDDAEDIEEDAEDIEEDAENIEPFKELHKCDITKLPNADDRDFVTKLYRYHSNWDTWKPETPLEKILYRAINIT